MPSQIYTARMCCTPAYQIDWSYCLFWRKEPADFAWIDELTRLNEGDGIRILQHEFNEPSSSQFLVSTKPSVSPLLIAQRIKERLQHLMRPSHPHAFRRNYSLRSIGSTKREKLDRYLETQLGHHPMADVRMARRLSKYQFHDDRVDLSLRRSTSHARYWYNLHVVLVNEDRYMEVRDNVLQRIHDMIVFAAQKKDHWLSRAAIVPDHIHLTMGCTVAESPEEVVLSYMNNIAYACGMKPVFRASYYVGTFREYDLGVIPRAV